MSAADGSDQVWGLISTLVGGPAVWGGIGYGVDRLADTSAFTPIGVVVGFVTAFYVVYVKTQYTQDPPAAPRPATQHQDGTCAARRSDTGDDAPS